MGSVPVLPNLVREAVVRGGHQCSLCGRPCSEREARRHTEPGPFGDSAMNFAAMCYDCQTWLAHQGVQPAQYVIHFHDRSKARLRLRWLLDEGLAVLVIVIYVAFTAFAIFTMYWTPHNPFAVLGCGLLIFYLLYLGVSFMASIRESWLANTNLSGFYTSRERALSTERER